MQGWASLQCCRMTRALQRTAVLCLQQPSLLAAGNFIFREINDFQLTIQCTALLPVEADAVTCEPNFLGTVFQPAQADNIFGKFRCSACAGCKTVPRKYGSQQPQQLLQAVNSFYIQLLKDDSRVIIL